MGDNGVAAESGHNKEMTFSIVARDPETGKLGVAVQTHWLAVGAVVPWVRAGVGAVATQSFANISFGPMGLDAMASGNAPPDVVKSLIAGDDDCALRQVAMVDSCGRAAAFTGDRCVEYASHVQLDGVSTQANMMLNTGVPEAMASAWEKSARETFQDRLMNCLDAGQSAGGDIRGTQSAALKIGGESRCENPWEGVEVDLRVDDASNPLADLRRLLIVQTGYTFARKGERLLAEGRTAQGIDSFVKARKAIPASQEFALWHGVTQLHNGDREDAIATLASLVARNPNWLEFLHRVTIAGLMVDDPPLLLEVQHRAHEVKAATDLPH